ncbi:hypothetical protein PFICI_10198 [Pestalotiopsis fici W106-1]|uniref:7-dehydrocholesterol reductase n=1 Tax=Pestalotiopsis fici (strain W106-1 / CGMCC3.15140) TaxID=1229662 RepID=W3WZ20_PESFW|nr:uncharacterized protein PFICI_10198 [Pestalotiopsis fici W106-1]ETS78136.1 hypothetical protein PFICI_10198 [Pestalotiopsis fici W106-1]
MASEVAVSADESHFLLEGREGLPRTVFSAKTVRLQKRSTRWHITGRSWFRSLVASTPVLLAPLASFIFYITLAEFDGSLSDFATAVVQQGFGAVLYAYQPRFTLKATAAHCCWIVLQAVLALTLPGPKKYGQPTSTGHVLPYCVNGLSAWLVTHLVLAYACWYGILDPAFVPRNWGALVCAMNLAGFSISLLAFAKAHLIPTIAEARRFSGCSAYDFYMGIELNPRLGDNFDLKLFTNSRIGMGAWTVIDLSNMAFQYQEYGSIGSSMILVTILHMIYVLDFFVHEHWYLGTIDIAHEHYGFYLAWGCFAFLPTTYTLQTQYLSQQRPAPLTAYEAAMFALGLAGYALFRSVNHQKDLVRRSLGNCLIWGKPAECIKAPYHTSDGNRGENLLLVSGWWGWSRHANYVGDLLLSFSMCALAGSGKLLVWFYVIYMAVLLAHRCVRDEARGSSKYGAAWEEYCRRVAWRLIPGVW